MLNDRSSTTTVSDSSGALKILTDTGLLLAHERNLDVILQSTLDAGLKLTDAHFGAFFHSPTSYDPEPQAQARWNTRISGTSAHDPALFPFQQPDDALMKTFFGDGIIRHHDISIDAAYGLGTAFEPFAQGGPHPVRSYFAIPVHDTRSALLGGMMYGHPEPHMFAEPVEALIASVAAQAGRSIENVRLHERLSREVNATGEVRQLQRATADRLARVLEAASDAIFLLDRHWRFTYLNPEAERAFANGRQLIGMTITAAFPGAASLFADHYVSVMEGQGAIEFTEFYESLKKWLSVKAYPTPDGVAVFVQDVTLRVTQEEALRQSEKLAATGRLAATIAHEINNPLEAVTNLIYLVKTDPTVPGAAQQLLETADAELARVAHIAQQTLGFYRDTTRPTSINVNALLQGVIDLFERKLNQKRIEPKLDLAPGLHVFGLQGELRQVFSNLIVNAIDATPAPLPRHPGQNLIIRARAAVSRRGSREVAGVSVLVCDQGAGIPENIRKQLFAPFFTTKQAVGTGLGLWVTRGMLEKQGGTIRFRSSASLPGVPHSTTGTIFRVFLPATMQNIEIDPPLSAVIQ